MLQMLYASLLASLLVGLLLPSQGAQVSEANITTQQQFLAALRNQSINRIVLLNSITLSSIPIWQGSAVAHVARNLTISGPLPTHQRTGTAVAGSPGSVAAGSKPTQQQQEWVQLDLAYLRDKVQLEPYVVLTFKHLVVTQSYVEWVPGVHFILYAPHAVVRFHHAVRVLPSCPPDLQWLRDVVQNHQLPTGYSPPPALFPDSTSSGSSTGSDSTAPAAAVFDNQLSVVNRTGCQQWLHHNPSTCHHIGLQVTRLAYEVPRPPDRLRAFAFVGIDEAFESYYPCVSTISEQCMQQHGYPECFTQHAVRAARAARAQENKGKLVLAILSAVAAVFLACTWWQQQQQQQQRLKTTRPTTAAVAAARGTTASREAVEGVGADNLTGMPAAKQPAEFEDGEAELNNSNDKDASSNKPPVSPSDGAETMCLPAADAGTVVVDALVADSAGSSAAAAAAAAAVHAGSTGGATSAASAAPSSDVDAPLTGLSLGVLVGAGSFGRVYQGDWNGQLVAVKVMEVQHPQDLRAVRSELAVNKLLQHPNVVRCLAYRMQQLDSPGGPSDGLFRGVQDTGNSASMPSALGPGSNGGGSGSTGSGVAVGSSGSGGNGFALGMPLQRSWTQVLLLLEYCDRGSLHDAILDGLLRSRIGQHRSYNNMAFVLRIALDVARGMTHIHSRNICHGDLCSKNVLLARCSDDSGGPLGLVAKVADFGLSRLMPHQGTHLSTLTHGTLTHMAPELLQSHRLRPAADVFSYGILLWELVHLGSTPNTGLGTQSSSPATVATGAGQLGPSSCSGVNIRGSPQPSATATDGPAVNSSSSSSISSQQHSPQAAAAAVAAAAARLDVPGSPAPAADVTGSPLSTSGTEGTGIDTTVSSLGTSLGPSSSIRSAIMRVYHHLETAGAASASPWIIMEHVIHGGRPVFTAPGVPGPYVKLAQHCWQQQPERRPIFAEIVQLLEGVMAEQLGAGHREDLVGSF